MYVRLPNDVNVKAADSRWSTYWLVLREEQAKIVYTPGVGIPRRTVKGAVGVGAGFCYDLLISHGAGYPNMVYINSDPTIN